MIESKALVELIKHYHEHRLGHAFLIETNDQDLCLKNLLTFLKIINCEKEYKNDCDQCNLCHLIDTESLPNLLKVIPDGNSIKKEQVMELKRLFQTKPIFSKYNMYLILNAETLNSSSANTLLKFIEEPEDNIIGFFITENKENIIDTIKSRCQIILDYYPDSKKSIPMVWKTIAINYIKEFELVQDEAILYNKNVLIPLIHERKELLFLFQSVFSIYSDLYQTLLSNTKLASEYESIEFILKKGISNVSKKMNLVMSILDDLNYNVNISLILDRFVLEGSNE